MGCGAGKGDARRSFGRQESRIGESAVAAAIARASGCARIRERPGPEEEKIPLFRFFLPSRRNYNARLRNAGRSAHCRAGYFEVSAHKKLLSTGRKKRKKSLSPGFIRLFRPSRLWFGCPPALHGAAGGRLLSPFRKLLALK
jgi:hypothetical protein